MSKNWKDILNKSKLDKEIVYVPNYFVSNFTWDDIINDIESASKTESDLFDPHHEKRGYFQYMMGIPSKYKYIDDIMHSISKEVSPEEDIWPSYVQMFSNLISENYVTAKHRDNWDGLVLQVLGQVRWDVFEDPKSENIKQSFIVNSGDMILIPEGVTHQVTALSPRVSLNMSFPSEYIGRYGEYEKDGEI
jgi:hypothetical protein